MKTNEKSYISVLKYLFDRGDEKEIKDYILGFNENDDEYDIFIQKLQEFAKMDNIEIIEEMIYDEELILNSGERDFDFNGDEQELENYLYGDDEQLNNEFDGLEEQQQLYKDNEDELSIEKLKEDVGDDSIEIIEDIAKEFGIEDVS